MQLHKLVIKLGAPIPEERRWTAYADVAARGGAVVVNDNGREVCHVCTNEELALAKEFWSVSGKILSEETIYDGGQGGKENA